VSRVFKRNRQYWIDFLDAKGNRHRKQIAPSKRIADEALANELNKAAREELFGVVYHFRGLRRRVEQAHPSNEAFR
jgi:hypothetical protein